MNELFTSLPIPAFLREYLESDDWYLITGKFRSILENNLKSSSTKVPNGVVNGMVSIGENCVIGSFVVIEGPVYIGNNVEIGSHAHIRAGSIIGDNCVVGYTAGIKNSLMMNGAKISNHTFMGDSIMCARARLGGHSETANRRFDQKEIAWNFKNGQQETGLDKLGSIIGEDSRIAGGVILAPGTVIGKNTFISSGANVSGYIPDGKFIKVNNNYEIRDNNFKSKLHQKSTLLD